MKDIKLGGFRNREETRPVVEIEISFQQKKHKYLFTLDDRGSKTPLLMNRHFMTELNLAIDPSRKFILTEKIDE